MLNAKQYKFVDKYVHTQDVKKAATLAGYEPEYGSRLYSNKSIKAEIDSRMEIVNTEKGKLTAKIHILGRELLDEELVSVIKSEISPTKLNAIEMGYRRIGMIAGDEFIPDPDHQANKPVEQVPRIFRASQRELITHTTETKQTIERVVERQIEATVPAKEAPSPYDF